MAEEEEVETKEETEVEPEKTETETTEEAFVCDECDREFGSKQALSSHVGKAHRKEEEERGVGEEEGLKPPEVEFIDTAIEKLKSQLPSVYGISNQRARNIIGTLRDNPNLLQSPQTLYMHIKQLANKANDYHLSIIINSIFQGRQQPSQQPPMLFGQQPQGMPPMFPPFQQQGANPHVPYYQGGQTNPQANPRTQQLQQAQTQERIQQSREEHDMRMKKLEEEIKESSKGEEKERVPVEFGDTTIEVPADLAPLYLMQQRQGSEESEKIEKLRKEIEEERNKREDAERESLEKDIERLREKVEKKPSFDDQLRSMEAFSKRMGYKRSGMSTIDLLNQGISRLDKRAEQLLQRMPPPGGEEGFQPEIERTPEQRRRKAEEIQRQMDKTDELIKSENELIEAASKVR